MHQDLGAARPISEHERKPTEWVAPNGLASLHAWWPVGRLSYIRKDGNIIDKTLVVELEFGKMPSLRLVEPIGHVSPARPKWPAIGDMVMGGDKLHAVHQLAKAMVSKIEIEIGYAKPGESVSVRRLAELVPHPNGTSVIAHDLDREAPRTFRLDRMSWVGSETPEPAGE